MDHFLEFEKPIQEMEKKIQELRTAGAESNALVLEKEKTVLIESIFKNLTPWQRVGLARHAGRPHSIDYIEMIFPDFSEIHGDRLFGDDAAIITGTATLELESGKKTPVLLIAQEKGRNTKQKVGRSFGMPRPEGYRKAQRAMRLADRFRLPLVNFIDTPGAYPGIDAEERLQAAAISESIRLLFDIKTPVLSIVIGEGGSGGALALGVGNRVLMQTNTIYSVISPESCASILWSDPSLGEKASEKLKLTAQDLLKFGIADRLIEEPLGGAHRDPKEAANRMKEVIVEELKTLLAQPSEEWVKSRREKFRHMGSFAFQEMEKK